MNQNATLTRRALPVAAIIATVLMWASSFVLIRWSAGELSPGPLALLRLVAGAVTLSVLLLIVRRGRLSLPSRSALGLTALYGVIWFALYTLVFNLAGHYIDAGTIAMVVNLAPIMVGIGAVIFFKESFSPRLFTGMVVSLCGIGLISVAGSTGQLALAGLGIALIAAFLYAGGMLIQKLALRHTDPLTATWLACAAGTVVLLPFLGATVEEVQTASTPVIVGAIYMGIGPTALGFWFWGYAMNHFPTGKVAASTLAVPAVVVLMSWLTLDEVPPLLGIVGGAVTLTGVAIAQLRRPVRQVSPAR
ncbi:DMT family transporter [Nesterenkonia lutea]|uniref:Drug/metabolite transporter (DMT)-like permease n=1 Tax=Nesterenkonia lutea TaxID=272919 RepID=A0ABR9JFR4_9MICC|nr:DMT family transporter [Nesterenkonia lutea]MBE1524769.1 drug/metabolite transporter (DMT)-like permease [Nesterenkonia lutea]